MPSISDESALAIVRRLIEFPYPNICRHVAAGYILDAMERGGFPLSADLAGAVVRAEDDEAMRLLAQVS